MAAPRTSPPARSLAAPAAPSICQLPAARSAAPPGSPGDRFSQSPLQATGSLLIQDPARPGAARCPACRLARILPRPVSSVPPLPPRLAREGARRAPWCSLILLEVSDPAGMGTVVRTWDQASE